MNGRGSGSGEPILAWRNFGIRFRGPGAASMAAEGVNLEVFSGETLALVGESGSGKSVTALSALQLVPDSAMLQGSIRYCGQEMIGASAAQLRDVRGAGVGVIFQEPMTALNPLHTVGRQVGEAVARHAPASRAEQREKTLALLRQVRLRDPETRIHSYPHQLSGGQRQRVMIAMALAGQPQLLIADEPTTALDVTVEFAILRLLKRLQSERGMAMLFITHDLPIVRRMADRVAVMQEGRVVETAACAELFDHPRHPYTRTLLDAAPGGGPAAPPESAPVVLQGEEVRVWFPVRRGLFRRTIGHIKAVDGISLTVRAGETVGVVGESGSGKTTLALALLRLIRSTGRIAFLGRQVDGLGTRAMRGLRRGMQIVFQDPYGSLSPRMSAADIVAEGLAVHLRGVSATARRQRAADALAEVGIDPATMDRYPHEFSGGQRQRIAIARAIILEPTLVVLDEPTSALDRTVQGQVVEILRQLQRRRQLAYVFVSHDLRVVRALAHNVIVMQEGRVVERGETGAFFSAPQTDYARALIDAAWGAERIA